jgi:hypothetical protein
LTVNRDLPQGDGVCAVAGGAGPSWRARPSAEITVARSRALLRSRASSAPTTEWISTLPSNTRGHSAAMLALVAVHCRSTLPVGHARGESMRVRPCSPTSTSSSRRRDESPARRRDDSDPGKPFPSGCKTNMMTPQAKALRVPVLRPHVVSVEPPTDDAHSRRPRRRPARTPGPPPGASKPPAPPPHLLRRRRRPIQDERPRSLMGDPLSLTLSRFAGRGTGAEPRGESQISSGARAGGERFSLDRRGLSAAGVSGSVKENVVPASAYAVDPDRAAALRLDQALRDVEAQAPSPCAPSPHRLPEAFEDVGAHAGGDPGPAVR